MAEGITRRHSAACRSRNGGRCNCNAGWQAWIYLPREGRKVYRSFAREAEAKAWRADVLAAAHRGAFRPTRRDTRTLAAAVAEFVAGMHAGSVRPKGRGAYKPATVRSYSQQLRVYIEPSRLGAMKVADITRADVQAFADHLLADGLSPGTVSNVLSPVQAFYRRAEDREEVGYNPTQRIDLPGSSGARPTRIASPADAAGLNAALPDGDRPLWATAFYAGLRRGELQALRCSDVDLGASVIYVERQWDQYEGPIQPKSRSSRRTIPLLGILRDHLDEHLLRTGKSGEVLVFGRSAAVPFAPMAVGKRAKRAWLDAGLQPITLHECRHTFASLLIDAGANPKAIQTFMGHSKIQTTFDTYGHLMPGSHDEVRERMDAYLSRVEPPSAADAVH